MELQLALRFSDTPDSAGLEFPPNFDFPSWFFVQGTQTSVEEYVAAGPDRLVGTTLGGTNISARQVCP